MFFSGVNHKDKILHFFLSENIYLSNCIQKLILLSILIHLDFICSNNCSQKNWKFPNKSNLKPQDNITTLHGFCGSSSENNFASLSKGQRLEQGKPHHLIALFAFSGKCSLVHTTSFIPWNIWEVKLKPWCDVAHVKHDDVAPRVYWLHSNKLIHWQNFNHLFIYTSKYKENQYFLLQIENSGLRGDMKGWVFGQMTIWWLPH